MPGMLPYLHSSKGNSETIKEKTRHLQMHLYVIHVHVQIFLLSLQLYLLSCVSCSILSIQVCFLGSCTTQSHIKCGFPRRGGQRSLMKLNTQSINNCFENYMHMYCTLVNDHISSENFDGCITLVPIGVV